MANHIVRKGESLWKISQRTLGAGNRWREIYGANRGIIKNPNLIYPGQRLTIPRGGPVVATPRTAPAEQYVSYQAIPGYVSQPSPVPTPAQEQAQKRYQGVLGTTTPQAKAPQLRPYEDLIRKYFPEDQWENAYNVMMAESSGKEKAIGVNKDKAKSRDYGLFQINDYWQREGLKRAGKSIEDMLTPEENIKYAASLYKAQGWRPWYGARKIGLWK